jgi:hypothetical protein
VGLEGEGGDRFPGGMMTVGGAESGPRGGKAARNLEAQAAGIVVIDGDCQRTMAAPRMPDTEQRPGGFGRPDHRQFGDHR